MSFYPRNPNKTVYYKFPVPQDVQEKLKAYKGRFEKLWIPTRQIERWCYVLLKEEDFDAFVSHFGENGVLVDPRAWELPDSIYSTSMHAPRAFDFQEISMQKQQK